MIKAICFDLDGVYFPSSGKQGFHRRLVELTDSEEKVSHALYKAPEMTELVLGKRTPTDFVIWINSYLNTEFTLESFAEFWIADYEINQEVQSFIQQIRSEGYVSCTVSNNNSIRVDALEAKFHFLADFDVRIFSYEVGAFKPDRQIFEELIKQTKVRPEEIIYSDDNPERIGGAQGIGIKAFVYEDFNQFVQEVHELLH